MDQNFFQRTTLHQSFKLEHFQWGVKVKFLGVEIGGGGGSKKFVALQMFRFSTIIMFPAFLAGGKNLPNHPEKKYGNIG